MSDETKQQYKVTMPIDLGDGVIHYAGTTVQLDLETAMLYRHALIAAPQTTEEK